MKPFIYISLAILLLSGCSSVRKTVAETSKTTSHTIYRDTTLLVELPRIEPQQKEQNLFTYNVPTLSDSLFNSDTLTIETYNSTSKAFISKNKLHLQIIPKDTAVSVTVKNAIKETLTQTEKEKQTTLTKTQNDWKKEILLILLIVLFIYLSLKREV